MRSRISTNQKSQPQLPFMLPQKPRDEPHCQGRWDQLSSFNLTSLNNTSRQTSSGSIYSLPFNAQNRNSTPPTPMSSPGLFIPHPQLRSPGPDGLTEMAQHQYLHPSQYRVAEPVRETHQLETDYDPVSGRKIINNYCIIEEIGRGTHGKVKLGYNMGNNELVAIKIVERSQGRPRLGRKGDGESSETKIRREIAILKKIRHENVVRLIEVIDDARSKKVYLVLEYVLMGEVIWRKSGNVDLIRRDRERLRRENVISRLNAQAANPSLQDTGGYRRHQRTRSARSPSFWSLEFASDSCIDSEMEDDAECHPSPPHENSDDSEAEEEMSEEDCYIPAMSVGEARRCFRDIVVGLDHLHWNGVIHRDIKPANLLWTSHKVTKISDFGVSFLGRPVRSDDDDGTGDDEPTGFEQDELELAKTAGTPAFFAPELCSIDAARMKVPITSAIDVWALGVTLFCFIYGRLPFMADNEFSLFKCIAEEDLVIPKRRIRPIEPKQNPNHRVSLEEYETEPVDEDLRDLIKRLLTKNPVKRILLKEVKRHPWVLQDLQDPINWVEKTDPERISHGNKIEVTTKDMEAAVSVVPSIVTRAKSVFRKAAGMWVRGLRRRGSSTNASSKEKRSPKGSDNTNNQDQPSQDEVDRELQWIGHTLGPHGEDWHIINSSAGSSETVHGRHLQSAGTIEFSNPPWSTNIAEPTTSGKSLRRKQSMNLLGGNLLRRHSTHLHDTGRVGRETTRSPASHSFSRQMTFPHMFKSDSTAVLTAPNIVRRMVRCTKSEDLITESEGIASYDSDSPLSAKEVLKGALYPRNRDYDNAILPTCTPQPRSLYKVIDGVENGLLNTSPKSADSTHKERMQRQRREEQEQARLRLGKIAIDEELGPPSPQNGECKGDAENQKIQLEGHEQPYHLEESSNKPPDGHSSRGSYTYPVEDWATPPIAMAMNSPYHRGYFVNPFNLSKHNSPRANLASSSSDEKFTTTAGSSLTNSASFPSVATNPSSVSLDFFLSQYSRKGSIVSAELDAASIDEDDRLKQAPPRRRMSEYIFHSDPDDSGSDSEGGFVMKTCKTKRARSVAAEGSTKHTEEAKDLAKSSGSRPKNYT